MAATTEILRLRPHHLLCPRGFHGCGYNAAFIILLEDMVNKLKRDDPQVQLVDGPDSICAFCPEKRGAACRNEARMRELDARALRILGTQIGERDAWSAWGRRVNEPETRRQLIREVCEDCPWTPVCRWRSGLTNDTA